VSDPFGSETAARHRREALDRQALEIDGRVAGPARHPRRSVARRVLGASPLRAGAWYSRNAGESAAATE
jgi:hypothetical protein